ncbi:helix-turn-helix domain-containing protein [uncultured Treponema sp.]|uniref:helix-turn-helix domain-containing protein n=1 Tax=uncultured Treponema sp. TaxID=162155 RepID=UPI0015BAF724|nr:helix-turn-helix domain-containing protein [uncultured Treponema sp.]
MNYIGKEPDYNSIGKRIRKYRWEKNISQEELAEAIGVSTTHMSHIETGSTKLSLSVFVKILEALNISADLLLKDDSFENYTEYSKTPEMGSIERQKRILSELTKAAKAILEKERI